VKGSTSRLDPQSQQLAAHPPVDDRWAARGVVDILRTRAIAAEIQISLIRLRDLVSESAVASVEPDVAVSVAAAPS
jgi:hypothetical protein